MLKKLIFAIMLLFLLSSWQKYEVKIENPEILTVSERYLKSQVGLKEKTGHNDGPHITRYMNAVGLSGSRGYPYCAAGQVWCLWMACKDLNEPYPFSKRSGLANFFYTDAVKHGRLCNTNEPKKHNLVVWKSPKNNTGHVERIDSVGEKGWVWTVGFNTSNGLLGSQRDGNGVFRVKRNLKSPLGRLRLRGLVGFHN
jgi:hypothetical protein